MGGNGSHSSGSGTGRDFTPVFSWDWDGKDSFLWEWDGRGLRIHSRVTLYHSLMPAAYQGSRFKVQDFFICHIINYTEYNQKWNENQIRSTQWTVQNNKNTNYIKLTQHQSIYMVKKRNNGREWESFFREWNWTGFYPSFFVDWDGKRFIFVGVGRERLKLTQHQSIYMVKREIRVKCAME